MTKREEAIQIGIEAIQAIEAEFDRTIREGNWDPFVGEPRPWITGSDRTIIASTAVVDALLEKGLL